MTSAELGRVARALLVDEAMYSPTPARIAARAVDACERLARHLAQLMGDTGSRAIFNRSLLLTRAHFPWIASVVGTAGLPPGESPWTPLRASMELQDPETVIVAFTELLASLVRILGNLIGAPFAARLLREAWPEAFSTERR